MKSFFQTFKTRFVILGYLFEFLAKNGLWWMIPMVLLLALFFLVIVLGQSTPLGPFIYTIF